MPDIDETKITEEEEFDPVAEIERLQNTTVSKDKYEKLQKDYAKLFKAYANGERGEAEVKVEVNAEDLRSKLFSPKSNLNNLEYIETALKLREVVMQNGERDPFLPAGKNYVPTAEDYEAATRVASNLKECVEYAKGDSSVFTDELQRRLVDVVPPRRK